MLQKADSYLLNMLDVTCLLTRYIYLFVFQPFQESQIMPPVFTGATMEQEMRNTTLMGIKPCSR